jgi:transposase
VSTATGKALKRARREAGAAPARGSASWMDRRITAEHSRVVSKKFLPYEPRQAYLLPPSPLEWLPEGHLARFILDLVTELDLGRIYRHYERELRGKPPHDPRMMVALLLYGYSTGVTSSRQIEKKTYEDIAFRVLSGDTHPDHVSVSEFRRVHLDALAQLFLQVLRLCQKSGLVKLGHVSLDGTKIKANASKHKAMSYERMKESERALEQKVKALLEQARQADAREDAEYGKDMRGDELPTELSRASTRLERLRAAKRELEEEAKLAHEQAKKKDPSGGSSSGTQGGNELPSHRVPSDEDGSPTAKAQRNFTDPESRIMVDGDGAFVQAYNAQIVVDDATQIIVAQALTNQPPDTEHALPLLVLARDNCGAVPARASMDAGYFSENNVLGLLGLHIDPYISTGRSKHGQPLPMHRGPLPKAMTIKAWMAYRLGTPDGSATYRRRKAIVEPVFGQIKEARRFRRFSLRGTLKVRGEWAFVCTAHNLGKLFRSCRPVTTPS